MDIAQISILLWAMFAWAWLQSCYVTRGAGMNSNEKFLLDIALVGLIIVLIWTGWRNNQPR
jgi:hypothetical protein